MLGYVGQGVGGVAIYPDYVSGLDLNLGWGIAFDVAAQIQIGYSHDQVRAGVMVLGEDSTGLQVELGDADAVVDEENVVGAAVQDLQAAFFISILSPFGRRRLGGPSRPA